MADTKVAALEAKIAELEGRIRGVNPSVIDKIGSLANFSAGSCTNECTAACTIGCTKGCTGTCVTQEPELDVEVATTVVDQGEVARGVSLFNSLAKR